MQQDWPGNIRELRNYVRRYCVFGEGGPLESHKDVREVDSQPTCLPWKEYMEQQEQQYVEQVLQKVKGQVSAAHQLMGISRKSLYDKINKYGLELTRYREEGGGG